MQRKSWAGIAAVGLVGVGFLSAARIAQASSSASGSSSGSTVAVAAGDVPSIPPVSRSMIDAMKADSFVFVPTEVSGTDLTAEKVADLATSSFGLSTGTPSALSFGRLTIPYYGKKVSDDPKDERISRYVDDRPVWLVRFNDVPQPRSGPVGEDGEPVSKGPAAVKADLWVALEAVTGETLYGATLVDPDQV